MLESIGFWTTYGLVSYIVYIGIFSTVSFLIYLWLRRITGGDFPTEKQGYKFLKWIIPFDRENKYEGWAEFFISLFSIIFYGGLVLGVVDRHNLNSDHEAVLMLIEKFPTVGYYLMVGLFGYFATGFLRSGYGKFKALKAKIDKLK